MERDIDIGRQHVDYGLPFFGEPGGFGAGGEYAIFSL
jgi:hypothetical protein